MIASKEQSGDRVTALQQVEENGLALQTLSEEFRDDKQIVLAAINQNWKAVEFASPRVRSMPDVMLTAVRMDWRAKDFLVSEAEKFVLWDVKRQGPVKWPLIDELPGKYKSHEQQNATYKYIRSNLQFTELSMKFMNSRAFIEERIKQNGILLANDYSGYNDDKNLVITAVRNTWRSLEYVSDRLKEDPDVWSIAFNQNWQAIRYSNAIVTDDETIMSEMCESNVNNIRFGSERLRSNKEWFAVQIKNGNANTLQYATKDLLDDKELVLSAISESPEILEYSSSRLRDCKEVVLLAITRSNWQSSVLKFASERLRSDVEIVDAKNGLLSAPYRVPFASEKLRGNSEFMLPKIQRHGASILRYVCQTIEKDEGFLTSAGQAMAGRLPELCEWVSDFPEFLRESESFMFPIVKYNPGDIEYCSPSLQSSKEFILSVIRERGDISVLCWAADNIRGDKAFILELLEKGFTVSLRILTWELQGDSDIALQILKERPEEIRYACPSLEIDDKEIIYRAVETSNCNSVLVFASDRLRNDKILVLKALEKSSSEYDNIGDDLKSDPDVEKAHIDALYKESLAIEDERQDQAHMDWLYGLNNTCTSCHESPCICSDPSRTSSLSDW